jgi:hypothetical protein
VVDIELRGGVAHKAAYRKGARASFGSRL